MSDLLKRIEDRSRPTPPAPEPVLSAALYYAVEHSQSRSFASALTETLDYLRTYNKHLRTERDTLLRLRDDLAAEIATLRAENARLLATIETLASQSLTDRERLITAEKAHTVWLAGLAVATLAAVIVAISIIR